MAEPVIFHVDVNSAFLSWSAVSMLQKGSQTDLRLVPSIIGGNQKTRHGIVLAKSSPAKAFHIQTGEPVVKALQKCPKLLVVPPSYNTYVQMSHAFMELLQRYAPLAESYSIDEAFCDMSGTEGIYGNLEEFAHTLKDAIREELGFTVNIGVSSNRLLAKMASDFQKPDRVHTLFPEEVPDKLWPLPIEDLFFVGGQSAALLRKYGISTIGGLAQADGALIKKLLKKHGETLWHFANGRDNGELSHHAANKGYSSMLTLQSDVTDPKTARHVLLSLCETTGARIRADNAYISVVGVNIIDSGFVKYSRQTTLDSTTNVTERIYETAGRLFSECWNGNPIRLLGVHTGKATNETFEQYDLFEPDKYEKLSKLNHAIDNIRGRYGEDSVKRACFVDSADYGHMTGGMNKARRTLGQEE